MKNFILGTDWWTDCDDAVALRLLTRAVKSAIDDFAATIKQFKEIYNKKK